MKEKSLWLFFKRFTALTLMVAMLSSLAPWGEVSASFAQIDAGKSILINNVEFVKEHNGLEMASAYVQITGSGLKGVAVLFDKIVTNDPSMPNTGGFTAMGTKVNFGSDDVNDVILKYTFTDKEAKALTGKLAIGSQVIDLGLSSFPTINKLSLKNVNVSKADDLVMEGSNLNTVGTVGPVTTTATYGKDNKKSFTPVTGDTAAKLTLIDPIPESNYGYQDIEFTRSNTVTVPGGTAAATVKYTYGNAFRFTQDIALTGLEMYPNIGAAGDYLYLNADNFPPANYQVYLMKKLDGTEEYSAINRATTVNLDATKKQLIVQVPNTLTEGDYNVVLTRVENNEVVAEQIVIDGADPDIYTLVDSLRKLKVEQVSPTSGPDTGVDVSIVARNMINLNIPGLSGVTGISQMTLEDDGKTLKVEYAGGSFNGKAVTVVRKVSIFVGNKATFNANGGIPDVEVGSNDSPDKASIKTASIDDVETDPKKDVLIETDTTLTTADSKVYVFKQSATSKDAFTFIPSTLTPNIDKVVPEKLQVVTTAGSMYKLTQDTQLVIKGSNFMVYRKVNTDGSVELKKPSVFIKSGMNISTNQYQAAFLPNENGGTIKIKEKDDDAAEIVLAGVPLELIVLNDKNEVVDGTSGNQVGTKIIVKVPEEVRFKLLGKKNIQVNNPRLGSDSFGNAKVKLDCIEVLTTTDYPIIESVNPNVVSVEGGVEVLVKGTNFANGVEVYIDGEKIPDVVREVDTSGDKINLKFKAPKGRVGLTQLQVINPSGGLAVWDFIYVKSFDKDPTITSFSPTKGIYGTLVSVNGDNYLKPDPTAPSNVGFDAFRLIGSKIYLDGKDINEYNLDNTGNLEFKAYEGPANDNLIQVDGNGKTQYSNLYKNAYVYSYDPADAGNREKYRLFYLEKDEQKRPVLTDRDKRYYAFRFNSVTSTLSVYDKAGNLVDADVAMTSQLVGTETVTDFVIEDTTQGTATMKAVMDNSIFRKDMNPDGTIKVKVADYAKSVILQETTAGGTPINSFFTISEDFEGNARLSNGKDRVYKIIYQAVPGKYVGVAESGATVDLTLVDNGNGNSGLNLDGTELNFTTAYKFDLSTNIITGNRVKVVSKDQILFTVPVLSTGTGYKDLAVVNPDTKRAEKKGNAGFYYVSQAGSYPVITGIDPAEGSDEGGYTVVIRGTDFQDGIKVIVDAQTVPDKDVFLALDGKSISFTMPKSTKRLKEDYGVDRFTVPVVVLNTDGASDSVEKGFTYIKPSSLPKITSVIANKGSANGNEIVEILGSDFRFFEPFKDADNDGSSYEPGDVFTDLNGNGKWDNYLTYLLNAGSDADSRQKIDAIKATEGLDNPYFDFYYKSNVLPRVFFGTQEAKIVHYGNGYLKVITPANASGPVNLYVVNNDSGISNKVTYTYESSAPKLTSVIPNIGKKSGQELKELYGTGLFRSSMKGYYNETDLVPVTLNHIQAVVRFGNIDNTKLARNEQNSGLINNGQATVNLTGGLTMTYSADPSPKVTLQVQEKGTVFKREFAYDNSDALLPMGMLKTTAGVYYSPTGITKTNPNSYDPAKDVYEYIRVYIKDRRIFVERGYAPQVTYDNNGHATVMTPSYFTIDAVPITYTNPDGGKATIDFTYTNPASNPKIYDVKPKVPTDDNLGYLVEGSVKGGWEFEIRGDDFREGATVFINGKQVQVVEITKVEVTEADGTKVTLDNIVAKVPAGAVDDIDKKYPIFVQNTDKGIANSTTLANRIGPEAGKPIYFVYRKPLSDPVVKSVSPKETSIAGNNTITVTGTDFRDGAKVIIGSQNGIPILDVTVSDQGTKLTFKTPTNLTLGTKSLTVQNADYGSGTLSNAITIVSAPVLTQIYAADGTTPVTRISLEGGEEYVLKGSGFMTGAKVYFGNAPVKITDDKLTGIYGLSRTDTYMKLENVIEAATVTYVDENTLKIKTPVRTVEGKVSITVLNTDKGISDGSVKTDYTVPIPSDPVNLNAELIADQYIRLYGYTSTKVDYYEIYYYIGPKSEIQLWSNSYKDFVYLTNTTYEPYRVTRLPGFENLQKDWSVHFVIKAVNKFGPSNYSNIATVAYDKIKHLTNLGQKDIDGAIGVPDGKPYIVQNGSGISTLQLSGKTPDKDLKVTLTKALTGGAATRYINLPQNLVMEGRGMYAVNYGDMLVQFLPQNLNTTAFRALLEEGDVYGRLAIAQQNNAYSAALKTAIPRNFKAASNVFTVTPYAVNNTESQKAASFTGSITIGLSYENMGVAQAAEKNVKMYKYDVKTSSWKVIASTVNTNDNMVFSTISAAGDYILLIQK